MPYRSIVDSAFNDFNSNTLAVMLKRTTLAIKKIIFNDPATIVYWKDGTKTVVKCAEGDTYSKSAGIALCYLKAILGDNFHAELKRLTKEGKDYGNSKDNKDNSNK